MELKPITREGVPAALQKANRYRLLNDSMAAESICEDVLRADPENVEALVTHVLSITDQFYSGRSGDLQRAQGAVARLKDPYRHSYYNGVLCERWAKSLIQRGVPRAGEVAHEWLTKALAWYEKAEAIRPSGNDEAILRWNTCVRMLQNDPQLHAPEVEPYEPSFE
jgi:hypothetical protein